MTRPPTFDVVVATDGSRPAAAAMTTLMAFPWPAGVRVTAVVGRRAFAASERPGAALMAYDRYWEDVAARARRTLRRRFPDADARVVDETPAEAIVTEAKRRAADVTVVGWRGHGTFRRLLMGSVSREVVRRAPSAVLVVRRARRTVRRFVVAVDGSPSAARAVALLARLGPPRGTRVAVVGVVEPVSLPSLARLPRMVTAPIRSETAALDTRQTAAISHAVDAAVRRLRTAGWTASAVVRRGAPLAEVLSVVDTSAADVLVLGARGTAGVDRLPTGSVAEGALAHCRVPVLVTP